MGKKNQKKVNNASTPENPKKLSPQKRNELNALVESLLKLGFKQANNPTEMWNQFSELHNILDRIIAIENGVKANNNKTNKNRSSKIESFINWAKENGATFDKIKISEFSGYELGLQAAADIEKDEILITIPRKIMISELTVAPNKLGTNIPFLESMANVKLAFIVLLEKLDENSFWKPFIDILPEKYSTLMYFTFNEMQELKGSNCFSNALNQCKSIARQYAFIYKCIQSSAEVEVLKEKFSYELYRWAVSTVMTRQNFIPELSGKNVSEEENSNAVIPALIPLWDMANHKDGEVTSSYNLDLERLESNALSNFKIGEQIFIYYGNRSNSDLLIHNGFVYPENSADSVAIRLGLGNHDELHKEKTELLNKLDIANNCELKVLPAPKFISPHLLAFVRVFHMNKEQLEHWINSERTLDLLHIDCALETSLESKTWIFLQNRLEILLRVFPTTLEDDEAMLSNFTKNKTKLSTVKGMVLHYRVLEKRILFNALEYAKQRTKA